MEKKKKLKKNKGRGGTIIIDFQIALPCLDIMVIDNNKQSCLALYYLGKHKQIQKRKFEKLHFF